MHYAAISCSDITRIRRMVTRTVIVRAGFYGTVYKLLQTFFFNDKCNTNLNIDSQNLLHNSHCLSPPFFYHMMGNFNPSVMCL